MTPLFRTPARYRLASAFCMAVNIGNILTFSKWFLFWLVVGGIGEYLFVALFHMVTILVLSTVAAKMALDGTRFASFIRLMESNGMVYDKTTKEFKPGIKM